ncbi:LuxR C-terminal-related transcriptional regulator [Dactylosporangium sp. NPDC050588]|uniref:Putative LuxR family transcriptional regulator n=1 Tax=Dactylosporangium aurantiacum subsp. hamdenensis TaxID=703577 RepID=E9LIQ7_9ACTN|nr:putative LuxR family transcriptional regulator [Dactylosporangium aurantiacum subsp. hamdenensis]
MTATTLATTAVHWPLVGRSTEVQHLSALLGATDEAGVLLIGEAGVGKSRLAQEVAQRCTDGGMLVSTLSGWEAADGLPLAAAAPLLPAAGGDGLARAFAAATRALRQRAADRPVLLHIDDAQHFDAASTALVQHLAGAVPAKLLVTARPEAMDAPALRALRARPTLQRVSIGPLRPAAVDALIRAALGGPVDRLTLGRLAGITGGNPLFLRHLVDAGLAAGQLRPVDGLWRWHGTICSHQGLRDLVADVLRRLDTQERAALRYVAHGEPMCADALETLAPLPVLEALERRQLIRVDRSAHGLLVRCGHPLYGELMRATATARERREVYRRLAEAVDAAGMPGPGAHLRSVLWRLAAKERVPVPHILRAARDALDRGDAVRAESLARSAGAAGVEVLAGALVAQDKAVAAEALLDAEHEHLPAADRAGLAALRALNLFWGLRRPELAAAVVDRARRTLPAEQRDDPRLGVAALALSVFGAGHGDGTLLDGVTGSVVGGAASAIRAYAAVFAGAPARVVAGFRDGDLAAPRAWASMRGAAAACHVHALAMAGELSAALSTGREYHRAALTRGAASEVAMLSLELGVCEVWAGRPARALPYLREARALVDEHTPFPIQTYVFSEYAACQATLGRGAAATSAVRYMRARLPSGSVLTGHLDMAEARCRAYAGDAIGGARLAAALGERYLALHRLTSAADSLYLAGRLRPCASVAAALRLAADRADSPLFVLFADHVEALVHRDADRLAAACEGLAGLGYAAVALEAAASGVRLEGTVRDSRFRPLLATLGERCEGFVPPWAEGVARPAALTGRERQIADLAATGMPNEAIAQQLRLSVRTVGNHLYRVYRKLGVTSRDSLARVLAAPASRTAIG